jgi:hypothetical protein
MKPKRKSQSSENQTNHSFAHKFQLVKVCNLKEVMKPKRWKMCHESGFSRTESGKKFPKIRLLMNIMFYMPDFYLI